MATGANAFEPGSEDEHGAEDAVVTRDPSPPQSRIAAADARSTVPLPRGSPRRPLLQRERASWSDSPEARPSLRRAGAQRAAPPMFGPVRAAHLRAPAANTDQDMQLYNRRHKVVAALASRGRHAPVDFAPDIIFYSFQQDHHAMLRSPALTERKLEDWAYGFGRWSIPQADDPCNKSDFQNMLLLASK